MSDDEVRQLLSLSDPSDHEMSDEGGCSDPTSRSWRSSTVPYAMSGTVTTDSGPAFERPVTSPSAEPLVPVAPTSEEASPAVPSAAGGISLAQMESTFVAAQERLLQSFIQQQQESMKSFMTSLTKPTVPASTTKRPSSVVVEAEATRLPKRLRSWETLPELTVDADTAERIQPIDLRVDRSSRTPLSPPPSAALPPDTGAEVDLRDSIIAELCPEKAPPTGPPIQSKLAAIIAKKWKGDIKKEDLSDTAIPANLTSIAAPLVNHEVWSLLNRTTRHYDLQLLQMQRNLQKAAVHLARTSDHLLSKLKEEKDPVVEELFKGNLEAVSLVGNATHQVSAMRRFKLKPHLNSEVKSICDLSYADEPSTDYLFGDDFTKTLARAEKKKKLDDQVGKSSNTGYNYKSSNSKSQDFRTGRPKQRPPYNKYHNNQRQHYGQKTYQKSNPRKK